MGDEPGTETLCSTHTVSDKVYVDLPLSSTFLSLPLFCEFLL